MWKSEGSSSNECISTRSGRGFRVRSQLLAHIFYLPRCCMLTTCAALTTIMKLHFINWTVERKSGPRGMRKSCPGVKIVWGRAIYIQDPREHSQVPRFFLEVSYLDFQDWRSLETGKIKWVGIACNQIVLFIHSVLEVVVYKLLSYIVRA